MYDSDTFGAYVRQSQLTVTIWIFRVLKDYSYSYKMMLRGHFLALLIYGFANNACGQLTEVKEKSNRTMYVVSHLSHNCNPSDKSNRSNLPEKVGQTYAELANQPKTSFPSSFTICSMAMVPQCLRKGNIAFFTLIDAEGENFISALLHSGLTFRFNVNKTQYFASGAKSPIVFPEQWLRSCLSVETDTGRLKWVVDGQVVEDRIVQEIKEKGNNGMNEVKGKVQLGQVWWPGYGWGSSNNKIFALNIFSLPFSLEEMQNMTSETLEGCGKKGDFFAWEDMKWILKGSAKVEYWKKEDVCQEPMFHIFNTKFPSWEACRQHCEKINSRIPSLVTFEQWELLQAFFQKNIIDNGLETYNLWLSLTDENQEGKWSDYKTGATLDHDGNYEDGQPNGGRDQNHILLTDAGKWSDKEKSYGKCGCICDHNATGILQLRGLNDCYKDVIDRLYKPVSTKDNVLNFQYRGERGTQISFLNRAWRLSVLGSNVTGYSWVSHVSFALGKYNWTIKGEKACNHGSPYIRLQLKLTGCQQGNFTCDNGQCIPMENRCDQIPDCRDKSDEKGCKLLVLEESYNKNIPPISSSIQQVPVDISIDLLSLVRINEEVHSIEFQFTITLEWKESRATYHNLKSRESLNVLMQEDVDRLWLPEVVYENTDQKESSRLGMPSEWKTTVVVKREQESFMKSGLDYVDEAYIFSGEENSLIMTQTYTHESRCTYNLMYYPFDTQASTF